MITYDLSKFITAHREDFDTALHEIRAGHKQSHWMWYIFPQIQGLGRSSTAQYYAIHDLDEAAAFLDDPYLGGNLIEICQALLQLHTCDATSVMGTPDDLKLRSSMTLFSLVPDAPPVFSDVLEKYYDSIPDHMTIEIIDGMQ